MAAFWMAAAALAAVSTAQATGGPGGSMVLQNRYVTLTFDAHTGAWTGFTDRRTGEQLVSSPARAMVGLSAPPKLDAEGVRRAIASGEAVDLAGEWLYTPKAADPVAPSAFPQGRYEGAEWAPTPIPSQAGKGDAKLHNRVGDFWYRRELAVPAALAGRDLTLVIGAIDDFDETYVNGVKVGATGAETPHHWESPRLYRVPKGTLRADRPNTVLVKVTNGAYDGGFTGPIALGLPSALRAAEPEAPALTAHALTRSGRNQTLRLSTRQDGYEYMLEYTLPDDRAAFTRHMTVRNVAEKQQILQGIALATPPLLAGPAQAVIFPGSLPVGDNPINALGDGMSVTPRTQDPLAVLWDGGKQRGIGAWYLCEQEYSPVSVQRKGEGAEIRHTQGIIAVLQPGQSVASGTQYLWLSHGTRDQALRGVQDVYRAIGLRAPTRGMAHLGEKVLYCGHPGGTPEQGFRTWGGFKAVSAYLPTLKKMGIDIVWFLPIWEHGDGVKWNLYSPFDHFKVSPLYGTADELKVLSKAMRENGVRLMFDLVPHGPPDMTPLAKEHPEWVCRDEAGKMTYAWNQYAFDNAHPGWQDYMRRAAEFDGREYGAIGARVDCGAGSPPNWNPERGNRPSLSTLGGGLGMDGAIREGFLKAGREVVLLPEEYTGANIFYRVSDLTYDCQLFYLMLDLHAKNATPEEWASRMQQFLHDQQMTLPPGALKMRWISNHDTVSWTFEKVRPATAYGVPRMRALLALCAFVEGVPMLYQGDEDPALYGGKGESNVEYLATIYGLRKRLPALRDGLADYAAARATGGVFACLRQTAAQKALVLISFNPAATESTVTLPAGDAGEWNDALSGERFTLGNGARVPMTAHQVRVLVKGRD